MIALCSWIIKIVNYIPQLLVFRTKVYYQDKSVQRRRIKGGAIVISNHITVMDFAVMMFVFYSRTLRCLMAELMFRQNFLLTFLLNYFALSYHILGSKSRQSGVY